MKPDWCDEATWERAREPFNEVGAFGSKNDYKEAVARALIASKNEGLEEAAALAETFMYQTDLEPEAAVAENVTAKGIAAAIRSRIQKE